MLIYSSSIKAHWHTLDATSPPLSLAASVRDVIVNDSSQMATALTPMSGSWFHGSIPRHICEEQLEQQEIGTFLVRESESRPGYSLSVKCVLPQRSY